MSKWAKSCFLQSDIDMAGLWGLSKPLYLSDDISSHAARRDLGIVK